jgi:regulator of RNase E activity RraA
MNLEPAVLDALRSLDTPTVCNALEAVAPRRRGHGYTVTPLVCPRPELGPIVGYARTATIRAIHPSGRSPEDDVAVRLAYYRHIAEGPGPTITVIQDLDPLPGYGAWWGEVNTNVHKGLGSLGVVTNGSIRDLDQCAEGFQLLAGCVGPSHAHVHVVDIAVTVEVAGMVVRPGDLLHADRHGAVVVPHDVAAEVPAAAARIAEAEARLIGPSKEAGFSYEVLERIITGGGGQH